MTEVLIVLIVAVLAVFGIIAMALAMHWGHRREVGLVPFVFYGSVFAAALAVALTPRDLMLPEGAAALSLGVNKFALWVGKLSSVFIILACGERIMHRLVSANGKPLPRLLMFGVWFYFATNIAAPAFFGRVPSVSHEYLYATLFAQAAMLFSLREVELTVDVLRNALLALLLGSAVLLVVKPSQVLATGYHGIIPFLSVRYAGLASHANTLGPLTVTCLLCLWRRPFARRWLNIAGWMLAIFSLVLAQSKTSWIAFILAAMCLAFYSYRNAISMWVSDHKRPLVPVLLVGCVMFFATALLLLLMFGDVGAKLDRLAASSEAGSLSTFSGREQIWAVALAEWDRNPIFGYGLKIWDLEYKMSIHMMFAPHAHGQFYQVVSSAGTVGLVGLIVYSAILTYLSIRTARASGGMTLALLISLYVRGVSEVPLSLTGFSIDTIGHLLLIVMLTGYCLEQRAKSPKAKRVGHYMERYA
jgi:O-antigen ligase